MNRDQQLMVEAAREIRILRQRNDTLETQMAIVRTFQAALLGPSGPSSMGPDLSYSLEMRAKELEPDKVPTP